MVVTDKTVLGEKQIELRTDRPLDEGPRLQPGTILTASPDLQPVPFQDVLAELEQVLAVIEGDQLARIVDALGFDQSQAELAGRNLDLLGELSDFNARTAQDQLARLRSFANVIGTLEPAADDITRLNRTLPRWAELLPDRQADVRAGLESLTRFSDRFATFLRIEEPQIDRLLEVGTIVGEVLDPRMQQISEYIFGVYRFTGLPNEDGFLSSDDGQSLIRTAATSLDDPAAGDAFAYHYRNFIDSPVSVGGNAFSSASGQRYGQPRRIRLGVRLSF